MPQNGGMVLQLEQKWACLRLTVGAYGQYLPRDVFDTERVGGGNERKKDQLADLFTNPLSMQKLKHVTAFLSVIQNRVSSVARGSIFPSKR